MHFYFDRKHTTHHIRIVMKLQSTHTPTGAGDSAAHQIIFNPFFIVSGLCENFQVINKERGVVHASFGDEAEAEQQAKKWNDEAHKGSIYRLQIVADGAPRWQTVASCDAMGPLEAILHTAPNKNECSRIIGPDNASHAASHCDGCCHLLDVGMEVDPNRARALA
jgi:hypothetical protein